MPFQSSHIVKRLKSRAHSGRFNSRNLEAEWHGPYNYMLRDLVEENGAANIVVHSQFPLWFVDPEAEDSDITSDSDNEYDIETDNDEEHNDERISLAVTNTPDDGTMENIDHPDNSDGDS